MKKKKLIKYLKKLSESMIGPRGPIGPPGPTGATGPRGPVGVQGIAGRGVKDIAIEVGAAGIVIGGIVTYTDDSVSKIKIIKEDSHAL